MVKKLTLIGLAIVTIYSIFISFEPDPNPISEPEVIQINQVEDIEYESRFDVERSVEKLHSMAFKYSVRHCAGHVRKAINAGGIETPNHPASAASYVKYLPTLGFDEIDLNSDLEVGDIYVESATKLHPHGHIAMWDGSQWVSDFKQSQMKVHSRGEGNYKLFRHKTILYADKHESKYSENHI